MADLQAGGIAVSPASLKIAGCALSGGSVTCDGTGFPTNNNPDINIPNGFPNDVAVHNVVGKVDVSLNQNNRVSGMYFFGNNYGDGRRLSGVAVEVAVEHSHASPSGWRKLGMDSQPSLGK